MLEDGDQVETGARGTRVRSRRRTGYAGRTRTSASGRIMRGIRSPWFERGVHISVGIAALVYGAAMVDKFHGDTTMVGFRPLGAPKSEMLYGFGRPEAVRNGEGAWTPVQDGTAIDGFDSWRYRGEGGGTYLIHYGGDGLSDEVTCFHPAGDRGSCPGSFWVNIGDTEDRIGYQLGRAPVRILNGPSAVLRYPSIGVDFELQQFRVKRITVRSPKSSIIERIPRFIRFAIP